MHWVDSSKEEGEGVFLALNSLSVFESDEVRYFSSVSPLDSSFFSGVLNLLLSSFLVFSSLFSFAVFQEFLTLIGV